MRRRNRKTLFKDNISLKDNVAYLLICDYNGPHKGMYQGPNGGPVTLDRATAFYDSLIMKRAIMRFPKMMYRPVRAPKDHDKRNVY